MERIQKPEDLKKTVEHYQKQGLSVGFVPTMGALHEGHLSLARRAKKENALSVMSIFVNPKQFGPNEDFPRYPRDLEKDENLATTAKVDVLFTPDGPTVYPEGFSTYVEETDLSRYLCGAYRPGHFRGVCTVVFRLFQMVEPDRAYFGQKDAQQLRILEKMVEDLNLPVEIVACPTERETDGLAMSSRNAYLSEVERKAAPELHVALKKAAEAYQRGERSSEKLTSIAKSHLIEFPLFQIQYLELRRWRDLLETEKVEEKSVLAAAAHLGQTRLIDNVILGTP